MKVALVHDWFSVWSGSEQVVEQILRLFPEADLFALVDYLPAQQRSKILNKRVNTTFIQGLPLARRYFRGLLPLMPMAIEGLDLRGYDLVISSNHAVAKGVITGPGQVHVCYVHSPMRYCWDLRMDYQDRSSWWGRFLQAIQQPMLHYLRLWDRSSANGVDHFIANSSYIAERIKKTYRRTAGVVYPPVSVGDSQRSSAHAADYVVVCRLVRYKRIDLLVEAFSGLPDRRLIVIGDGPERSRLQAAASSNIEFRGRLEQAEMIAAVASAKAYVYAAEEDFGIAVAEAQALGVPVIAYARGGQAEIVVDGKTGLLFKQQTAASVRQAIAEFEDMDFDETAIKANAERFGRDHFLRAFQQQIDLALQDSQVTDSATS